VLLIGLVLGKSAGMTVMLIQTHTMTAQCYHHTGNKKSFPMEENSETHLIAQFYEFLISNIKCW